MKSLSISEKPADEQFRLEIESSTYGDIKAWFPIIRQPGCEQLDELTATYISEGPMRGTLRMNFKWYQMEKVDLRGIEALNEFYLQGTMKCRNSTNERPFNVTVRGAYLLI